MKSKHELLIVKNYKLNTYKEKKNRNVEMFTTLIILIHILRKCYQKVKNQEIIYDANTYSP